MKQSTLFMRHNSLTATINECRPAERRSDGITNS